MKELNLLLRYLEKPMNIRKPVFRCNLEKRVGLHIFKRQDTRILGAMQIINISSKFSQQMHE